MSLFFDPSALSDMILFGAGGVASKLALNYTFWLQSFFFIVCYIILSKFFFPPVMDVLLKRQKMVDQAHQELKRYDQEGQELEQAYQDKIREARAEAQRINKEARTAASSEERSIVEEARADATQTMNQRETQAREQRDNVRKSLSSDAEKLGTEIASKVLGRSL